MLRLLCTHDDVVAMSVNAAPCEWPSRPIVLVAQSVPTWWWWDSEEWTEIKLWIFFCKFVSNSESHDCVYFVQLHCCGVSLSLLVQSGRFLENLFPFTNVLSIIGSLRWHDSTQELDRAQTMRHVVSAEVCFLSVYFFILICICYRLIDDDIWQHTTSPWPHTSTTTTCHRRMTGIDSDDCGLTWPNGKFFLFHTYYTNLFTYFMMSSS